MNLFGFKLKNKEMLVLHVQTDLQNTQLKRKELIKIRKIKKITTNLQKKHKNRQ